LLSRYQLFAQKPDVGHHRIDNQDIATSHAFKQSTDLASSGSSGGDQVMASAYGGVSQARLKPPLVTRRKLLRKMKSKASGKYRASSHDANEKNRSSLFVTARCSFWSVVDLRL
jgi:hypothetical protein